MRYYIRPYLPSCTEASLTFKEINGLKNVQPQREKKHKRFLMEKLSETWLLTEPMDRWFDNQEIYDALKEALIARLMSEPFPEIPKTCNIKHNIMRFLNKMKIICIIFPFLYYSTKRGWYFEFSKTNNDYYR